MITTRKRSRSAAGLSSTGGRLAKRSKRAARARSTLRSRTSSRLRRKGATSTIQRAIEKWWSKKAEVKMRYGAPYLMSAPTATLATPTSFTTAITAPSGELYMLIPQMTQGYTASSRVGDYISPRKLIIDLRASLIPSTDINSGFGREQWPEDIMVHIFFLTSKKIKDPSNYASVDIGQMMGYDGHATGSFDGTLLQADKPVNKEDFHVIKRLVFRLKRTSGFQSLVQYQGVSPITGPPTIVPAIANGGQDTKRFKVSIPMPKKLQYKEPSSTAPENFYPFMCCGWTYTHAQLQQTVSNLLPLQITATSQLYYTDD